MILMKHSSELLHRISGLICMFVTCLCSNCCPVICIIIKKFLVRYLSIGNIKV